MSVIAVIGLVVAVVLLITILRGAPWLPTRRADVKRALDYMELEPESTVLDLGCGSGNVLRAAAERGYNAIGYEINPLLYVIARWRTRGYDRVKVYWRDYWRVQLPPADGIFVFSIGYFMEKLHAKLSQELTQPTIVVSYTFPIPGKTPIKKENAFYVYRFTPSQRHEPFERPYP